jgi:electron transport complex protein RnfG
MKNIVRLGIILMVIAGIAAGVLSQVDKVTNPIIKENAKKTEEAALQEVFPDAAGFVQEDEAIIGYRDKYPTVQKYFIAQDASGNKIGAVFNVNPYGYSSNIVTLVGVNSNGEITAIKVLSQAETPGLGVQVMSDWFQDQFKGKSANNNLNVDKDGGEIQAITASTISSRAVAKGVREAVELFNELQ